MSGVISGEAQMNLPGATSLSAGEAEQSLESVPKGAGTLESSEIRFSNARGSVIVFNGPEKILKEANIRDTIDGSDDVDADEDEDTKVNSNGDDDGSNGKKRPVEHDQFSGSTTTRGSEGAIGSNKKNTTKKRKMIRVLKPGSTTAEMLFSKRVNDSSGTASAQAEQVCPKCGVAIPVGEMMEHVRIELLDPRGKEQRKLANERARGSNLEHDGSQVVANLDRMARRRPDIFGQAATEAKGAEANSKQPSVVQWDGHRGSRTAAKMQRDRIVAPDARREIRRAQEAARAQKQNAIGPRMNP